MVRKIKKIILAIIFAVACITCITLSFISLSNTNKKASSGISIVKELSISSSVTNALTQKYNSKITGKIKNNTANALSNVVLIVQVKTNHLNHTGTITITIPSINAKSEYDINEVCETNENFETISSISYQINGSSSVTIENSVALTDSWWILLVIAGVLGISCIGTIAALKKIHKTELQAATQVSQEQSNNNDLKLEQQKIENENKQIELGLQQVNLDITKTKLEQQKLENEKPIRCSYCGIKNDAKAGKCSVCGAPLK